jgi:hypothetical protein
MELSLITFTASLRGARNFILGADGLLPPFICQRKICEVLLLVEKCV